MRIKVNEQATKIKERTAIQLDRKEVDFIAKKAYTSRADLSACVCEEDLVVVKKARDGRQLAIASLKPYTMALHCF